MFREALIGTPLEPILMSLRDRFTLLSHSLSASSLLGDEVNNQLAAKLIVGVAKPGSTFLDIGAHIGSMISKALRADGLRVIAVEAIPSKAERLVKKFPNVKIECCALSDQEGEATFYINLDATGYSSLHRNDTRQRFEEIRVPLKRLDEVVTATDIDAIKIDVEGAELGVLKGGEGLITRNRPTIMFESGPEEVLGYTKQAMWEWFNGRDYVLLAPDRLAHTGAPMTLDVFLDSHNFPRRTTNYFAVHKQRVDEIRDTVRRIS